MKIEFNLLAMLAHMLAFYLLYTVSSIFYRHEFVWFEVLYVSTVYCVCLKIFQFEMYNVISGNK